MSEQNPFSELRFPCLMGIVNVTPNSFSDGGQFLDAAAAVTQARELARTGARILDLGAEASSFFRAGVEAVPAEEQLRRLLPVLQGLRDVSGEAATISVDTRSAAVAHEVLREAGNGRARVGIINDISAGLHEPGLLREVAAREAGLILMHLSPGFPATPTTDDADILRTVLTELKARVAAAAAAGVRADRIAIDPGIGFGKTMADNWRLAAGIGELTKMGMPAVVGASRKRFLETIPPPDVMPAEEWHACVEKWRGRIPEIAHARDAATAAFTEWLHTRKDGSITLIHRVHDVALGRRALGIA